MIRTSTSVAIMFIVWFIGMTVLAVKKPKIVTVKETIHDTTYIPIRCQLKTEPSVIHDTLYKPGRVTNIKDNNGDLIIGENNTNIQN